MTAPPVYRFAPTPNGALHLGHALSALTTFDEARDAGGRFLLRIEDIDTVRARPEHVEGIFRDLAWLGIEWEQPVLYQSSRFDAYRMAARALNDMGLLYRCFATRSEIAAAADPKLKDPDGAPLYPRLHKTLSSDEIASRTAAGEPFALRIDIGKAIARAGHLTQGQALSFTELDIGGVAQTRLARPGRWGDAVIVRKSDPASYHLAVVVDDAHQNVTNVTRGRDLLPATDLHALLQALLGLPVPVYRHHRLMTDERGRKLAKSAKDQSLKELRASGLNPADIRRMTGLG